MTRLMYDSTSPGAIPADAPVVAGYADGRYQWSPADWARFPNAVPVSIACSPLSQADVLDVETGCATPTDVSGWLDRYTRPRFPVPTLYVNRANWDAVRAAAGARRVDYWVSTLDGTRTLPGAAAVQYCGAAGSGDPCQSAGNYDLSLCQDYWPREETSMPVIIGAPNRPAFLLDGRLWVGIADVNDVNVLVAGGVRQYTVSTALFDAINAAQSTGAGPVDLSPITGRQDALARHLGLGVP